MAFRAASAGLELISASTGIVDVVAVGQDFISSKSKTPENTVVRITLGQSPDESADLKGNVPGVALWDINGKPIGFTPGTKEIRQQGTFVDIEVSPNSEAGNVKAHYISVTNGGDDAICITGLTITHADESTSGFSANLATTLCGVPGHVSQNQMAGDTDVSTNSTCMWIDRNGSLGLPFQGFGIHLPSFSDRPSPNLANSFGEDSRLACSSEPRFKMYENLKTEDAIQFFLPPPEFFTNDTAPDQTLVGTDADVDRILTDKGLLAGPQGKRRRKRDRYGSSNRTSVLGNNVASSDSPDEASNRPSPGSNAVKPNTSNKDSVIISPHSYNSARQLCAMNSWGPSLVSLTEGLFCDVHEKILYYTCDNKDAPSDTNCCYDTKTDELHPCEKAAPIQLFSNAAVGSTDPEGMRLGRTFTNVRRW